METIDARDLACPEPVIRTKKALEGLKEGRLNVILNSADSCENVQRFVKAQGCEVSTSVKDGVYTLDINKTGNARENPAAGQIVMLIGSDQLGSGDESLGQLLITALINALPEAKKRPSKMLFINRAVFLTTQGSRVLDSLRQLENEGVEIFSCGTCLNHYHIKDHLKVGKVTNMYDTVETLLAADNVIRL